MTSGRTGSTLSSSCSTSKSPSTTPVRTPCSANGDPTKVEAHTCLCSDLGGSEEKDGGERLWAELREECGLHPLPCYTCLLPFPVLTRRVLEPQVGGWKRHGMSVSVARRMAGPGELPA